MNWDYSELLRDKRWQQKRLWILEQRNWTCEECKTTGKRMEVHHLYYEYGLMPWEYDDDDLCCLCEECHRELHAVHEKLSRLIDIPDSPLLLRRKLNGLITVGVESLYSHSEMFDNWDDDRLSRRGLERVWTWTIK